jgi:hypothetical protein
MRRHAPRNDIGFGIAVTVNAANAGGVGSAIRLTAPVSHPYPARRSRPAAVGDRRRGRQFDADRRSRSWAIRRHLQIRPQRCVISGACTAIDGAEEREFDQATAQGEVRLIFVKGADDASRHPKMRALIGKAGAQLIRRRFTSISDLTAALYASLVEHLERSGRQLQLRLAAL